MVRGRMRRQKTAREILDATTPEKELQNTAIELFHNCGWLVERNTKSGRSNERLE